MTRLPAWPKALIRRLGPFSRFGERLRHTLQLLHPTWWTVLLLAVLGFALAQAQSAEALRAAFHQTRRTGLWLGPTAFVYAGALLVAFSSWYATRFLLAFRFGRVRSLDGSEQFVPHAPDAFARTGPGAALRRWVPRLLGAAPLAGISLRFAVIGEPGHALAMAVLSAAFVAFVVGRRRIGWFGVEPEPRFGGRRPDAWMLVGAALLLSANGALLLYLMAGGAEAARRIGAAGIVLSALAGWITLGSFALVYTGCAFFDRHWWPRTTPFLLLALWVVALSGVSGNHELRTRDAAGAKRPTLEARLDSWSAERSGLPAEQRPVGSIPLVVVSAEGGGIRAAYWTASVLAALSDEVPGFACALFAVSGVSGGSVGAAAYATALAGQEDLASLCQRERTTAGLSESVRELFSRDHLSPPLAGLVSSDLFQRFVPTRLLRFDDRATWFEEGLESWPLDAAVTLASPFDALWAGGRAPFVPSLFLNTTRVETGGRAVVSDVRWAERTFGPGRKTPPVGGIDLLGEMARMPSIATAAHASARFPVISPPGSVRTKRGSLWGHVVDGGYFENSGALTASEVAAVASRAPGLRVIRLVLTNDPGHPVFSEGRPPEAPGAMGLETRAIARAFWRGRGARGHLAEWSYLVQGHSEAIRLRPRRDHDDPALGWLLDDRSLANLDAQVDAMDTARLRRLLAGAEAASGGGAPPEPDPEPLPALPPAAAD